MRKLGYPGTVEAEREKTRSSLRVRNEDDEPDMLYPGVPNYEKFERMGWDAEKTLAWLNID